MGTTDTGQVTVLHPISVTQKHSDMSAVGSVGPQGTSSVVQVLEFPPLTEFCLLSLATDDFNNVSFLKFFFFMIAFLKIEFICVLSNYVLCCINIYRSTRKCHSLL